MQDASGAALGYRYGEACSSAVRPPAIPILIAVSLVRELDHEEFGVFLTMKAECGVHHRTVLMMEDCEIWLQRASRTKCMVELGVISETRNRWKPGGSCQGLPQRVVPSGGVWERSVVMMTWVKEEVLA